MVGRLLYCSPLVINTDYDLYLTAEVSTIELMFVVVIVVVVVYRLVYLSMLMLKKWENLIEYY